MAPPRRAPKDLGPLTPTALRDYVRFNGGKTVIQHFRVLDADGSGDLTSKEFLQGVRLMGFVNATKEEAAFVWDWLDKDGDGASHQAPRSAQLGLCAGSRAETTRGLIVTAR